MTARIRVVIGESEADPERLDELTTALRDELLDLDLDDVTRVHDGTPPPDARSIDLALAGVLLILLKQSVDVAAQVIAALRAWKGRGTAERTVSLTIGDRSIQLTDVSRDHQDRLIREFLQALDRQ